MKTAKMTLQIILALTLPLNAMAVGNSGGADNSGSIENRLNNLELKLELDKLQKEIALSVVTIQALEDIADPSLLSFYRQYDTEIALAISGAGWVSSGAVAFAGVNRLAPNRILIPAFKTSVGVFAAGLVWTMGEVIQSMIQDTDYRDIHARLERSSPEEQQRAFLHHKNIITERAPRIEQLTKQLEGSEQ